MPRWVCVLALLAAWALVGGARAQAQPVANEPVVALDGPGAQCSDPALATDAGARVACAWISRRANQTQVMFRENNGESWDAPVAFAPGAGMTAADTILLYDAQLQPHLLWRESDAAGHSRLRHASRQSGFWVVQGTVVASPAHIADPSADFDAQGHLHLAWREGNGSFWSVKAATIETSGTATIADLTQGQPPRLYLYPTVIGRPVLRIFWFAEDGGGQFRLDHRQFDVLRHKWLPAPIPDLSALPMNRLPLLFAAGNGAICGVWVDAWQGMERIFWAMSSAGPTHDPTVLLDVSSTVPGSQPYGQWSGDGAVVVWRGETADGPAVCLRHRLGASWTPPAVLPAAFATQPRVVERNSAADVAWISDAADGGDGNLYTSVVRWNE